MLALQHPNIVRLVEFTTEEPFLYLVMEFCDAGDLSGQMKNGPLTEERAHYFMMQLVAGLQILHSHKIIHRDLKPANLLLSTQRGDLILKIADFGFAKIMEDPNAMHNTYCGSPLYMAPEVLETSTYNSSADLWSVGAILYEMVCGDPPFNARSLMELLNKINVGTVDFPPTLSETCCSLISGLLKKDSTQRMSWTAFFTHSWLCDMFQSPPQNQSPPLSHNSTPIFSFKSLPTGNPVSPLNPPSTPNSSQTTMPPPTLLPNAMPPTPLPPTNPNPLPNPPMSFLPIKHSQANTTEKPLPSVVTTLVPATFPANNIIVPDATTTANAILVPVASTSASLFP
ncbi:protein kinase [Pelomyxa schiedti]|nr:protein kinase [Pelomyxa schiedti]